MDSADRKPASHDAPPACPDSAAGVILFDGQCAFCQRSVKRLGRWTGGRFEAMPQTADAATSDRPGEVKLVLADGRAFGGAEAIVRALAMRPAWRLVTWIYFLPGIRQLANAGYRFIARHRHRL